VSVATPADRFLAEILEQPDAMRAAGEASTACTR
jgi:hypothetical protein